MIHEWSVGENFLGSSSFIKLFINVFMVYLTTLSVVLNATSNGRIIKE
jgi:hypothetical protein